MNEQKQYFTSYLYPPSRLSRNVYNVKEEPERAVAWLQRACHLSATQLIDTFAIVQKIVFVEKFMLICCGAATSKKSRD